MKKLFVRFAIVLIALLMIQACKTQKRATTSVTPAENFEEPVERGVVYALPKTELFFNIRLVKTTVVPGPYHEHGEELLGLSQVPHNLNTYWELEDIEINEYSDADFDHLYVIEPEGRFSLEDKNFTKKGWILPLTENYTAVSKKDFYKEEDHLSRIHYKELSVKKFVGEETRTVYKSVWKDSLYAKVPVEESYTLQKNLDEKAQEAANFIFMIREKRIELISGMGDYYPEGEALQTAVNEMNSIEERYLDLFTGKKFKDTINYTLHWTPTAKNLREPDILFRFSSNEGLLNSEMQKGTPVWIEFNTISDTKKLAEYFDDETMAAKDSKFFYRIPAKSLIRLKFADKTIARKYLEIFQYGEIIRIPLEYMNDQKIIEYYQQKE